MRSASTMASQSTEADKSIHDFTVKDARGNDVDLSIYKGKVLLIVNVASQWPRNTGIPMQSIWMARAGSNEQILEFAFTRFKAEYPIFDKVDVNGDNTAPIYKFLKSSKGSRFGDNIEWNFVKFLVDKDGNVVDRFVPFTSPLSIEEDVKKLLGVS